MLHIYTSQPRLSASRPTLHQLSALVHEGITKSPQTKRSQNAQSNRQRLSRLDGTGDRATSQDDRGEKRQLDTVCSAAVDTVATKNVLWNIRRRIESRIR